MIYEIEYLKGNSLCCNAPIKEQFHTCSECGMHAEPAEASVTFLDGSEAVVDEAGILRDLTMDGLVLAWFLFAAFVLLGVTR